MSAADAAAVLATARDTERAQAGRIAADTSRREEVRFTDHPARRARDPTCTFRRHLRGVGGEIEV